MRRWLMSGALCLALIGATQCDRSPEILSPAPSPAPGKIDSEAALIEELARAYVAMDLGGFGDLLSQEESAPFRFIAADGQSWDAGEEIRIHSRMFRPRNADPPLPKRLWIRSVALRLQPQSAFLERSDLYGAAEGSAGGLDPDRWRATEARYRSSLQIDTAGGNTFVADGVQRFVVIENLEVPDADSPRFLLYRWEDLGAGGRLSAASPPSR